MHKSLVCSSTSLSYPYCPGIVGAYQSFVRFLTHLTLSFISLCSVEGLLRWGPHKHTHAHSLGGPHHIKVRNVGLAAIMYECMDLVMPSLPFFRCGVCGGVVCVLLHAISEPSFMFTHFSESALKCQCHYPESVVLLKCYNSQTDLGTPGPVCLVPLLVMLITVLRHLMSFFAFFLSDFPLTCSQT